jgi:para-aminobenzoate synthetase component 1
MDLPAPLVREIEIASPLHAARALARLPAPFLLHAGQSEGRARWSFFGAEPFATFGPADYDDAVRLWRRCASHGAARAAGVPPLQGGLVGYWAYDFGRRLERWPRIARDDLGLPDVRLSAYDVIGAYDHLTRRACLMSSGLPLDAPHRGPRAEQRLDRFTRLLAGAPRAPFLLPPRARTSRTPRSTFTPDEYRRAVEQVREHIGAGDIFQANLSQRWSHELPSVPTALAWALHESLALCSPAPFSAFLGGTDHAIASSSPEGFLRLRQGRVETRPIKGTRPRAALEAEDARLQAELLASAKDRAENVMIVDVLRNDLGRVCATGTVEVTALCELETFAQVHHLTSTVRGRLAPGRDAFDLLHACFPGGSITGAPKLRAIEILEGLEPVRRHVYTGAIGYLDWNGDADWNIAIRTALVTPRAVHFAAGGGITADSDPDAEYQETLHKASGMVRALEPLVGRLLLEPDAAAVP